MIPCVPNPQTLSLHNLLVALLPQCIDYIVLSTTPNGRAYTSRMNLIIDQESFASDIRLNGFCVVAVHGTLAVLAHESYSPTPAF